ncbi:MAG: ribose 5-phosphate isomerase B [Bacteroidetes bacterium]|nr:ribose 5-phosphate isomerase B [Bacteroidota bacterium]
MNFHIGSDHAGYDMKEVVKKYLISLGHTCTDYGTNSSASTDYPDYAHAVASAVEGESDGRGILLCGSANGVCMTANKHAGIRAALCWTTEIASLARQHNNANILCIPARFISDDVTREMVVAFVNVEFEGGRHQLRVDKISC